MRSAGERTTSASLAKKPSRFFTRSRTVAAERFEMALDLPRLMSSNDGVATTFDLGSTLASEDRVCHMMWVKAPDGPRPLPSHLSGPGRFRLGPVGRRND